MITINPEKIGDVIGSQGKVINKIIENVMLQSRLRMMERYILLRKINKEWIKQLNG